MDVRQLFAPNLHRLRNERRVPQEQLAHDAGVNRGPISAESLTGSDGRGQGIDHGRELVLGRGDDAGVALLEFDGLGSELDGHYHLAGRISLPLRPDGLLLGGGLSLPVDLRPSLDGSDVLGVLQEQPLLFPAW
jgi:hypothetical protein